MTNTLKEADKYFRETPPDTEVNIELQDKLDELEKGLNEEQLKALRK